MALLLISLAFIVIAALGLIGKGMEAIERAKFKTLWRL